jgi:Uma2 family endonuclease
MTTTIEHPGIGEAIRPPVEMPLRRKPSESPPARLTMEEATELADGRIFELIDGRMVFKMPDDKHSDTQSLLSIRLGNYFLANPIGRVRTEFEHRFWPDNPYEGRLPDLSVILNESLERDKRYATRAPDLAIEIVSLGDKWTELFEKAKLYLEKGSRVVWIADPFQKGVMVITPTEQRWERERLTCPELMPGFSVTMDEIFTWPEVAQLDEAETVKQQ